MTDDLPTHVVKALNLDPLTNSDVITLIREPDGNYRGFMQKAGKLIQARQGDPQIVLMMLITHE